MLSKYIKNRWLSLLVTIPILLSGCATTLTTVDVQKALSNNDVSTLIAALSAKDVYVRKEAASALIKAERSAVPSLINILKKKKNTQRCGYVAIVLGEIGAKEAIPILINLFPSLEETEKVVIDGADIPVGVGGIVNYRVLDRRIIDVVPVGSPLSRLPDETSMNYDDIPEVQALKKRYGKFLEDVWVRKYHAEYFLVDYGKTDIIENLLIKYTVQAAAYSLNKLTGQDFGKNRVK